MIEKHYAVHLKDILDAAAINVRKPKPTRPDADPETKQTPGDSSWRDDSAAL